MLASVLKPHRLIILLGMGFVAVGLAVFLLDSPPALALDEAGCLACHGITSLSTTDSQGNKVSLYVSEEKVNTAAHRYISCITCHPDMATVPHTKEVGFTKLSQARQCGTCHAYQYRLHSLSIHGQSLLEGSPDAATCLDCHATDGNPHGVIRVLEYTAPTYKKNIAGTCAACHAQEELMADYGIVERVYESYMRSFHGKATQLGAYKESELEKATCTNCHGVHDIQSVQDPTSPVAGAENLAKTCESCHPGAGVEFALGFLGHKEASRDNIPAAMYAEIFFTALLVSVVAFGALIMLVATRKYFANRWKETP